MLFNIWGILLVFWALFTTATPEFPLRFSASVQWSCLGEVTCGGLGKVSEVYQDLNAKQSLLIGLRSGEPWGSGYVYDNVLITPTENVLARFVWKTHTTNTRCSDNPTGAPRAFFANAVSILEGNETINGVMYEKWTNGVIPSSKPPYPDLWAVWFAAVTSPNGDRDVARISYTQQTNPMHGFPIPGWTYNYDFTNFTTNAILESRFEPPSDWKKACPTPPPPAPTPPPSPPPPPTPRTCTVCFACGESAAKKFPPGTKCAPERWDCSGETPPGKGCFNVECDPDGDGVPNGTCDCDKKVCVKNGQ
jgi:hypothetical protein